METILLHKIQLITRFATYFGVLIKGELSFLIFFSFSQSFHNLSNTSVDIFSSILNIFTLFHTLLRFLKSKQNKMKEIEKDQLVTMFKIIPQICFSNLLRVN